MPYEIANLIRDAWLVMLVVWMVTAFATKRSARVEESWQTWLRYALMATMFYVLYEAPPHSAFLRLQIVSRSMSWEVLGLVLTVVGVGFAIWARFALGGNWSSKVTIKHDHKLIIRGPYRIVRNPIYTGICFALVGTAIAAGQVRHFLVLPAVLAVWAWKIANEQRFLAQQFGEEYARYCREVKAFIPYVI